MYKFILTQYIMRKIDASKVQSYVPMWITQEQANDILSSSQIAEV